MASHHENETLEEAVRRVMRRNIARTSAYWIGDRRPFGVTQQDGPLDVVLWVERDSGETRSATPVPTGTDPEALAWELLHTIECDAHELPPAMPATVAVSSQRDAEHLRTLLRPLDIDVLQRNHHDLLDPILSELVLEPTTKCGVSFLEVPGVDAARVAVLFELATVFYLRCPWSDPNLKPHLTLPRTRQAPQVTVKLNTSDEDPELQLFSVDPTWPSRNPAAPDRLVMTYMPAETLAQELLDDIRANRWLCSPDLRAPVLMVMPPGEQQEEEDLELPEPAHIEAAITCFQRLLATTESLTFSVEQALEAIVSPLGARLPSAGAFFYTFRLQVRGVEPPIWRQCYVRAGIMMSDLHLMVQYAIGWGIAKAEHEFRLQGRKVAKRKRFEDLHLEVGATLEYHYRAWVVDITLEQYARRADKANAFCPEGGRATPPANCEGPGEYAEWVAAVADPHHARHQEMRERLGPKFDPERYDMSRSNRLLKYLSDRLQRRLE